MMHQHLQLPQIFWLSHLLHSDHVWMIACSYRSSRSYRSRYMNMQIFNFTRVFWGLNLVCFSHIIWIELLTLAMLFFFLQYLWFSLTFICIESTSTSAGLKIAWVNLLTSAPNICAAFIQYCATSCFLHLLDDGNMEPKGEEKLQSCLFSKLCLILPSF